MLKLRYYCQKNGNEEIRRLLAELEAKQKIPYEILDLSRNGEFNGEKEKQAYEMDFKPRARIMKQRTGQSITKLKSAKHGNYYVSEPGTIAIVSSEGIEWFAITVEAIISFLKEVLSQGQSYLDQLIKK